MANENKTLDQLVKQVQDSQQGLISQDELMALFREEEPAASNSPPQQQPVVAAPQPIPQAPAASAAPPAVPVQGEPNDILGRVPEKFRDKDVATSLEKFSNSYLELEQARQKDREELARLRELVEGLSRTPASTSQPQTQVPIQGTPTDDIEFDDVEYLEKPKETIRKTVEKMATKIAAQAISNYHNVLTETARRQQLMTDFRKEHSDFDTYVEDMRAIIQARPDLDNNPNALPTIYEFAKQRYSKRIEAMKTQLGVQPQQTTMTDEVKQALLKEATERAKKEIFEEVAKRRNASGTVPSGNPTTPQQRVEDQPREKPKTYGEELFDAMMASGPTKAPWEKT